MTVGTAIGTMTVGAISFRGQRAALPLIVKGRVVSGPEWIEGSPHLPAAFAAANPAQGIGMLVTLRSSEPSGRIELRATRIGGGGTFVTPIGDVVRTTVDFRGGTEASVVCRAALSRRVVGLDTVRWRWEMDDGSGWTAIGITEHEIAVTLGQPTAPWGTSTGRALTRPWWEVLEHACDVARGATTVEDAATAIAARALAGWRGAYEWKDSQNYATNALETPARFDCAAFLRLLAGDPRMAEFVDCSDLAAVVSTFANVLGCSLQQAVIKGPLTVNPFLPAGHTTWHGRTDAGLHEVTMARLPRGTMQIWDGCMLLSHDRAPDEPRRKPPGARAATGMLQADYVARLIAGQSQPAPPHFPGNRPIGPLPTVVAAVVASDPRVRAGARHWSLPDTGLFPNLLIHDLTDAVEGLKQWQLVDRAAPEPGLPAPGWDNVIRARWRSVGTAGGLVIFEGYLCADVRAAHLRTQCLLGALRERPIDPAGPIHPVPGVPEFRFSVGDGAILVGVVLNVAFVIRVASRAQDAAGVREILEAAHAKMFGSLGSGV